MTPRTCARSTSARGATAVGTAANWLLATTGALAGLILGGLFLPLVMLGLHQALIPVHVIPTSRATPPCSPS